MRLFPLVQCQPRSKGIIQQSETGLLVGGVQFSFFDINPPRGSMHAHISSLCCLPLLRRWLLVLEACLCMVPGSRYFSRHLNERVYNRPRGRQITFLLLKLLLRLAYQIKSLPKLEGFSTYDSSGWWNDEFFSDGGLLSILHLLPLVWGPCGNRW